MSKVVLVTPSGNISTVLERLGLPSDNDSIGVISWTKTDVTPQSDGTNFEAHVLRSTESAFSRKVSIVLSGNSLGRNLLRLSPLDPGRKLCRAVRRDAGARALLRDADVVVVTERDGILTGWHAGKNWARPDASVVYGLAPAEALLQAKRGRT